MVKGNAVYTQKTEMRPVMSQAVVMRQAHFLQLPDSDYCKLISEIEQDPVFRQLYREKLIRYHRFRGTDIHPSFVFTGDDIPSDSSFIDIEEFIDEQSETLAVIREIGDENFRRYFLFPEDTYSVDEISAACDIGSQEIEDINDIINKLSVLSTFYHPSDSASPVLTNTCLGSIDRDGDGFIIKYYAPAYARGSYEIDYGKFEMLVTNGRLSKKDATDARNLLGKLEMINNRKNILQNVLVCLAERQSLYLKSGTKENLLPLNQKEVAGQINAVPSSVSRIIHRKSIVTPWNEEIPLTDLLPNPRVFKRELVRKVLESSPFLKSDEEIRARILEKSGVTISRRSVSELRKELNLPASGIRRKDKVTG